MDKRHKIFFIAAAAIFLLFVFRMALLAGSGGTAYRNEANELARYRGKLSAIRGRIFDENGKLIVWSERCYDLVFIGGRCNRAEYNQLCQALKKHFPEVKIPDALFRKKAVLKYNLTAEELEAADILSCDFAALDVELRWERRVTAWHDQIGEVKQIDGQECGISGWEKEFESHLRGTPGEFEVMLDRHGKWVDNTFRLITPAQSGQDLYLQTVKENSGNETAQ